MLAATCKLGARMRAARHLPYEAPEAAAPAACARIEARNRQRAPMAHQPEISAGSRMAGASSPAETSHLLFLAY